MARIGAVVVAVFTTALLAQEQAPRPRFRAGVTFVQVDVSVLDRDRVPVRGLSADEFTVAEDGRPQKIVTFQEIDVPAPEQPPAPWMSEVAPDVRANDAAGRRLFVLVLDDGQVEVAPLMMARVKEIGRRIIDQLGPNDLAAVVFTKNNSGAQDFTNDRARLLRAVNAFAPGRLPAATVSPHLHIQGDRSQTYFDRSTVGTLGNVAKYLTAVQERRKALIYISVGVPVDFRNFRGDSTLAFETQHAVREAQRANVNIYAIDPSGLGWTMRALR